ncbi:MscS Mechanosensitive ion channel [Cyanobium sp. PCC 7001]|uniref:mechanosensitive ion channel family protein n=1 Tax=Cyanobium sp. PCC 7001 TaxID=180281 RepID=UPI00018056DF|nr:mechanosensitive ion channel domain-containing protein [Cyanobium sp. PCC 7001]EDY38155.1 MscS Mechanosensitive ion channel [Cyanobium sp. PCC 7001]
MGVRVGLWRTLTATLLGLLIGLTPALAQGTATANPAPILLDGRTLFNLWPSRNLTAEQRSSTVNGRLEEAVASGRPVQVTVEEANNLPVLSLNGRTLVTVTERDVPEGLEAREQAEQWQSQLEAAIARARQERTPEHMVRMLPRMLAILLAALGLHLLLRRLWRRWCPEALTPLPLPTEGERSDRSNRFLLRSALVLLQSLVWLGAAALVMDLFPLSRSLSAGVVEALRRWLSAPFLPLGSRSYSLQDVVVLVLLFIALAQAVGMLQSLLRRRVLRYTGMSEGGQEAVAFVARYGLLLVGTLVLLQLWGLDLTSLTLFASVLGVGVGLGLQGISKNFLSGLIIIFERPIQVGDFVEIGDLQGTVESLGLRSTKVTTLDRVTIIVPNSEFLESRVINWSHGSSVSRLQVPVGVAYGSDTTAVREALIAACKGNTAVLKSPQPRVYFSNFGDSSLNFTLLVWTREPRRQYEIVSDLNYRIEALLRERGITVPFPQRDLHLGDGSLRINLPPALEAGLQALLERQQNPER